MLTPLCRQRDEGVLAQRAPRPGGLPHNFRRIRDSGTKYAALAKIGCPTYVQSFAGHYTRSVTVWTCSFRVGQAGSLRRVGNPPVAPVHNRRAACQAAPQSNTFTRSQYQAANSGVSQKPADRTHAARTAP